MARRRPIPRALPDKNDILRRAAASVVALELQLGVATAGEEYTQSLTLNGDWLRRQERALLPDVLWLSTGEPSVWAFLRDVRAVDGQPVADRKDRLEYVLSMGGLERRKHAARIRSAGTLHNLGPPSTVNDPTLALWFLHPRNLERFRFDLAGAQAIVGVRAMELSQLDFDAPGLGPTHVRVQYQSQPRLEGWLPLEMRETYGRAGAPVFLEAVAKYSDYRKGEVELQEIHP